jgi:SAM-dependent methyltransferase
MPVSRDHWQRIYDSKEEGEVSWYEPRPQVSLDLIDRAGLGAGSAVIDIGAGASRLVDCLVERGFTDITVLDLSEAALHQAQARLVGRPGTRWVTADVLAWRPPRQYDLWHDRALFHFLTDPADRRRYVSVLSEALRPGGHAVIGTFAPDGPERCSRLPVVRYDAAALLAELGPGFALVHTTRHDHHTPSGALQRFQYGLFRKL